MLFFLVLKIVKNGYYGNGVLFLASDLGIIFLGLPNFKILGFRKKNVFLIQTLKFYRKMCGLFPFVPIFKGLFDQKVRKKCVCTVLLKIAFLLVGNVFLQFEKSISEKVRWVAQKHPAIHIYLGKYLFYVG